MFVTPIKLFPILANIWTVPLCLVPGCLGCCPGSTPQLSESSLCRPDTHSVYQSVWNKNHTSKNQNAWFVLHQSQNPLRRWDVSPLSDDPVCVLGYMVVANDMVHAGQRLVNIVLQPLQVLCLFVHWDDGVLQLHQSTFKWRQNGHLSSKRIHQTVNYKTQHVKSLFTSLSLI